MNPTLWSRDFALVGGATGALAPFFVIFDPGFAFAAGVVGTAGGLVLGGVSAVLVGLARHCVPLPVLVAAMAGAGAVWGAVTGAAGGAASLWFGAAEGMPLGFVLGSTTGMVALAAFFLPYLVCSVRGAATWPVVVGAALVAPAMGWLGLAALVASTFGLWLFALPVAVWAGVLVDRQARALPGPSPLRVR